ncbi:hypothetical protein OM076_42730 [Solirubrobacter ginsenosidimutans]|uniref:Uncharacterized protein n=1 Tax=Solirubrobacter ginsenosidimutans TaxID=490573 RepID=A0A9X3S5Q9_9ACTN|nr:hypothetical protein [Solirubrobacter ginsenosidimutans]MDA0167054.1 hypothetical protein [Solirubrobacter ginsenosidimutans]
MSELLERIHGEIRARLAASAAAVRESERLEAALAALDGVEPDVQRRRPAALRGARSRSEPKAIAQRAPRGANREAALRVIGERPGIGAGDLAAATGIKRAVLYALLTRLVEQGELVKHVPVDGPAGYALATIDPTVTPVSSDAPAKADADLETQPADGHAQPRPDGGTAGETSPPDIAAVPAAATPDEKPVTPAPRTRRRAKAKPAAVAAPEADVASAPPGSERPADAEVSTPADGTSPPDHDPGARATPVTSAPAATRRAAKPRSATRAPRRAKPKPAA